MSYLHRFLEKLSNVTILEPGKWSASCPAHHDDSPSLSVSLANDGKIIHRCFAGCKGDDIRKALGLQWSDYWPGVGEEPVRGAVANTIGRSAIPTELPLPKFHEVYTKFLGHLELSKKHRDQLLKRGLSEEAIRTNGYKTLAWVTASKAFAALESEYGRERLLQVPGFRLDNRRKEKIEAVAETGGLLIPVRGKDRSILGLKVRQEGKVKYRWLSGDGSPSIGSPTHVTSGTDEVLYITEGPLKADVISHFLEVPVVGLSGVGNWKGGVPIIRDFKPEVVVLAFDIDWRKNPGVARGLLEIGEALSKDYDTRASYWKEEEGKGLDDVLVAKKGWANIPWDRVKPQIQEAASKNIFRIALEKEGKAPAAPQEAPKPTAESTPLREVKDPSVRRGDEARGGEIQWIYDQWLPKGSLVLLEGDPGQGKGFFSMDLAARVTKGESFPFTHQRTTPTSVLVMSTEDDFDRIIAPRFTHAGGDLKRLYFTDALIRIPGDLSRLDVITKEHGIGLVILDPLSAYLDSGADANSEASVRQIMSPLFKWLNETGVSMIGIRHLSKQAGQKALYRGLGSIAFTAQARVAMMVTPDPNDPSKRILHQTKNNYAPMPNGLRFSIWDEEAKKAPRVVWIDRVEDITGPMLPESALDEAKQFLLQVLKQGPISKANLDVLAQENGISDITLRRAKKDLGVVHKIVITKEGLRYTAWALRSKDFEQLEG